MPETTQIIQVNTKRSVQQQPSVAKGETHLNTSTIMGRSIERGPLLPHYGTRERENALLGWYRNDYNTLYKSGIAGLIKRIQSTPFETKGDSAKAAFYQDILMNADFGRGWDSFISKMILDFSRYDGGAYIELIGGGDPLDAIVGAVTGFSVLDSLRCVPTGDPLYPVIYMDMKGKMHIMHTSRIVRFFDNQDTDERTFGYGECSLSRCISAVSRDILVNRYVERNLDDNPAPGLAVFKNLASHQVEHQVNEMLTKQSTDAGNIWGRTVLLYGLQAEAMPEVEFTSFSNAPEKFDLETYKNLNVKEIALGIGLDIQDMWELTGGGIGSGTQSEILHNKSKGRALGRALKGIERIINQALPEDMEFTFKYVDADEDRQAAEKAQLWSNVTTTLKGNLTEDEQRQLLANQIESVRDVITDQSGQIIRLNDADPKTPAQVQPVEAPTIAVEDEEENEDIILGETQSKQINDTQRSFKAAFVNIAKLSKLGVMPKAAARLALRAELQEHGERAYRDGAADGGLPVTELDKEAATVVSRWRSQQVKFIDSFTDSLFSDNVKTSDLSARAQMWVNKSLNTVYYEALGIANKDQRYIWIVDPQKEHCRDCLKLNGQVHRMKEFISNGLLPQSEKLDCHGYNCGCRLEATDLPARGNLKKRTGGLLNVLARLAGNVARLLKG